MLAKGMFSSCSSCDTELPLMAQGMVTQKPLRLRKTPHPMLYHQCHQRQRLRQPRAQVTGAGACPLPAGPEEQPSAPSVPSTRHPPLSPCHPAWREPNPQTHRSPAAFLPFVTPNTHFWVPAQRGDGVVGEAEPCSPANPRCLHDQEGVRVARSSSSQAY